MRKAGYAQADHIIEGKERIVAGNLFRHAVENGKLDVIRVGRFVFVDEEQAKKLWQKKIAPPPPPKPPKPAKPAKIPPMTTRYKPETAYSLEEERLRRIIREEVVATFSDDDFGRVLQAHIRAVFHEK
jgi:hypothetical protein